MSKVASYYDDRSARSMPEDFLTQVGHTEHGKPITTTQFERLVNQISTRLKLGPEDRLLDLCCGNGVITRRLASKVQFTLGVDVSPRLVETANRYHRTANADFEVVDVRQPLSSVHRRGMPFTKILMYAALQHFRKSDFEMLIDNICSVASERPTILLGFVPERSKKWVFYGSWSRRLNYVRRRLTGSESIGTWWDREEIEQSCQKMGLKCATAAVDPLLLANAYRFDAVIRRGN